MLLCLPTAKPLAARSNSTGFTLIELLLVLVLLVVVSSFAIPVLTDAFAGARLSRASDQVQTAWANARLQAIETGQPVVFRYQMGGSNYRVELASAVPQENQAFGENQGDESGAYRAPTDEASTGDSANDFGLAEKQLNTGITFLGGQQSATGVSLGSDDQEQFADDLQWSEPIMFHADGSTSDVILILQNKKEQCLRITLRGLTGISRSSEIGPSSEILQ